MREVVVCVVKLLPMELVVGNYIFNDASNNVTYYFNVCANVWPPAQCGTLSGACMLQSNSGTWSSLGNQTELQVAPYVPNAATDGVTVTYPHGAYECQPGVFASTQLSIACDQNDSDGTVHSVTVSEACVFQVAMSSRYGCGFVPSTGHSLVWWMLVVGLPVVTGGLVLVLLVVVGAWLYARHKQQYEQL